MADILENPSKAKVEGMMVDVEDLSEGDIIILSYA